MNPPAMHFSHTPLKGIIPPVPTPFTPDGEVDAESFKKLAAHLLAGGIDAAFIAGTAGLGPQMTDRQFARLAGLALEYFGPSVPVLGGVMECSTLRAMERIRILESLGYDRFVLTSTYYLPPRNQQESLVHFGRCAEATAMEMIAYNIPSCTGIAIESDTLAQMAARGWTRTIKDSSGDAEHFARLCAWASDAGVAVFQGLRPDMCALAKAGAAGCVPVPGNIRPDIFSRAWRAAVSGDEATARALQVAIDRLWDAAVRPGDFLSGTLYALSRAGLIRECLPPPFSIASAEQRAAVDAALAQTESVAR